MNERGSDRLSEKAMSSHPADSAKEFAVVGLQLVIKMNHSAHEEDVQRVMRSCKKIGEAMTFTAAAILPQGIDCRIEVVEI